jgi:hypothetical protein
VNNGASNDRRVASWNFRGNHLVRLGIRPYLAERFHLVLETITAGTGPPALLLAHLFIGDFAQIVDASLKVACAAGRLD